MIKGIIKAFNGVMSLLNVLFSNQRDNEHRKDGARQTDLAQREKQDEVRADAKKVRRRPAPKSKRDAIKRVRRNKGKGRN